MRPLVLMLSVWVGASWLRADEPSTIQIRPIPVSASGSHQIIGNEIILDGTEQVVLIDMMVDDWDPAEKGTLVRAFQVWLDPQMYTSGLFGMIEPYFPDCAINADCANAIAIGSTCNLGAELFPLNKCTPGFISTGRPDYIFRGRSHFPAVDLSSWTFRWAAAMVEASIWITQCAGSIFPGEACYSDADCEGIPSVIPAGTCVASHVPRYLGTLALFVPADAVGTFTVRIFESPRSTLIDDDSQFLPVTVGEALISVSCTSSATCAIPNACLDTDCVGGRCVGVKNYDDAQFCCAPADASVCDIPTAPGDDDNDADRDLLDVAALQRCFGVERSGATCASADLSCDCAVDGGDYKLFADGITGPGAP